MNKKVIKSMDSLDLPSQSWGVQIGFLLFVVDTASDCTGTGSLTMDSDGYTIRYIIVNVFSSEPV